tara:strand:- start:1191 stop:1388 length:198 start_codon:yes stop_codon:yes gene_type:complete
MVKIIKFETIKKSKNMEKQQDHVIPLVIESLELNIAHSLMDRKLKKAKDLENILQYLKGNNGKDS